jgi:VWFA-related protein
MKKVLIISSVFFLSLVLFSQQILEETTVINIEVPVRVFSGDTFINDLTIDDFEVLENGKLQNIEAVYLIKRVSVERSQEKKRFAPKTARNFFLFFELSDYNPKIGDAVRYFVHNVLTPGDNLSFVTSMKTYRMKNIAFEVTSREEIARQLIERIRRDTMIGNSEYRQIMNEVATLAETLSSRMSQAAQVAVTLDDESEVLPNPTRLVTSSSTLGEFEGASLEEQFTLYENYIFKLDDLRKVSQENLINFAKHLKEKEGQKYVTIFYQKEFIPQLDPKLLNQTLSLFQDSPTVLQTIANVIEFYKRELPIDIEKIKRTYADGSISIHFLYLTRPQEVQFGVYMEDHSEDIYSAFTEMATATGGFVDSSARADVLFKRAVDAAENYYLLYYSPSSYKSDGQFREIEVKVKSRDYRIFHRAGYFAN